MTKITLGIDAGREGETNLSFLVRESFDEVLEKFWPLSQPASQLEARTNAIFTLGDNSRVLIKIPSIVVIEENCDE